MARAVINNCKQTFGQTESKLWPAHTSWTTIVELVWKKWNLQSPNRLKRHSAWIPPQLSHIFGIDIAKFCLNQNPYNQAIPAAQQEVQRAPSAPSPNTHNLREGKGQINYKALLHLGQEIKNDIQHAAQDVKQKCKSMQKSVRKLVKAAITKLALGAFSPRHTPRASAPSSPHHSTSSSWTFWPSK